MKNISESVSYLKGLAEGLYDKKNSKNSRLIKGMLDVLDDMAKKLRKIEGDCNRLDDYISEIDDDLADVEKTIFDDDDDDCTCGHKGCDCDDDDDMMEIECPKCGNSVFFEPDDDLENLRCPSCFNKIDFKGCLGCCGGTRTANKSKNDDDPDIFDDDDYFVGYDDDDDSSDFESDFFGDPDDDSDGDSDDGSADDDSDSGEAE